MNISRRVWLFTILFGVPLAFLYPLSKGKPNTKDLPYFGKTEELAKKTEIKDFLFYDIDSNVINKQSTEGKTLVVSTLIPSCPYYCPIIQKQLKFLVYDKLYQRPAFKDLLFISHLIDTTGNKPNLSQFLNEQVDYDFSRWKIVVGEDNPIYDIDLPNANLKNTDFISSTTIGGKAYYQMILLIDRNRKVRGMYQGEQTQQIENMRKDIRKLFIEYKEEDFEKDNRNK